MGEELPSISSSHEYPNLEIFLNYDKIVIDLYENLKKNKNSKFGTFGLPDCSQPIQLQHNGIPPKNMLFLFWNSKFFYFWDKYSKIHLWE